jgi:hypothetical protein
MTTVLSGCNFHRLILTKLHVSLYFTLTTPTPTAFIARFRLSKSICNAIQRIVGTFRPSLRFISGLVRTSQKRFLCHRT